MQPNELFLDVLYLYNHSPDLVYILFFFNPSYQIIFSLFLNPIRLSLLLVVLVLFILHIELEHFTYIKKSPQYCYTYFSAFLFLKHLVLNSYTCSQSITKYSCVLPCSILIQFKHNTISVLS